ncbi:hypothetical protein CCACVL1_13141 [Corchorus capsularis]|uniref:Uncharacterized protein n=1 Tax=Corchorus capsularis TaxID=210143 RepID=A0A1R3ICC5_COCAP|nr:hypothetical protein CCACVL1_13141 [Corchorus capsularis]
MASPVSPPLKKVALNDEMMNNCLLEVLDWVNYVFAFCIASFVFGSLWCDMIASKLEKQHNNEDFGKSSIICYGIFFVCYLIGTVAIFIMKSPKDVIRKIASDDSHRFEGSQNNFIVQSTWFTASVSWCSLFLAGMLLWLLNDVADMIVKYKSGVLFSRLIYTAPYSLAVTSFLSLAVVFGFKTYYLRIHQMPISG